MRYIKVLLMLVLLSATHVSAGPHDDALAAYMRGEYAIALRLWRPLAEKADALAQYNLGTMYDRGLGVTEDIEQAIDWYRRAGEQGDVSAQYHLARIYAEGRRVPKNDQAAYWYRRAAERDDPDAQYYLSLSYREGRGVPRDIKQAYFWWLIASAKLHGRALQDRDKAEAELTATQRAEVQAQASKWKPKGSKR